MTPAAPYVPPWIVGTPAGLTRADCPWGTIFRGTPEAVMRAGLAMPEQLPGSPGRGKYLCTYYGGYPARVGAPRPRDHCRKVSIRQIGRSRLEVWVGLLPEEIEERCAKAEQGAALKAVAARRDAHLASLPESVLDHRACAFWALKKFLEFVVRNYVREQEDHGYSYSREAANEFDIAAARLLSIIKGGAIEFDRARHEWAISDVNVAAARCDGPLQAMLAMTTAQALSAAQQDGRHAE